MMKGKRSAVVGLLCRISPAVLGLVLLNAKGANSPARPNIVFLLADQWRAAATGYAGDPNVKTPHLDRLARQSLDFTHAISGCPVCSPFRASLLTGQRPLTDGVFLNDVPLDPHAVTLAKVLRAHGYKTAYIGKWHLNGGDRSAFIPKNRRQGFEYWKAMECTHNYNNSWYYAGDSRVKKKWDGYDAFAQTKDAEQYLRNRAEDSKPFLLILSWGPPHQPYRMAPSSYLQMYNKARLKLRPNVPPSAQRRASRYLAFYYAQCSALDHCVGEIWRVLKETDLEARTILVFTSDHGDMLGSQGQYRKQRPWDESIRVPLLFHYPDGFGKQSRRLDALINSQDLMPTLLGLCHVPIPSTVEGLDYSGYMAGGKNPSDGAALITCPSPFGNWDRANGGREYRGIRTLQYTYVRTLKGPWLLYDDLHDPYQLHNLCGRPKDLDQQAKLDEILQNKLKAAHDQFLPGTNYIHQWGYRVDANGNAPH